MPSGFFEGIDYILPVPLHRKKERLRGYNQSEWLAKGVGSVTSIPVLSDVMERCKYTETTNDIRGFMNGGKMFVAFLFVTLRRYCRASMFY